PTSNGEADTSSNCPTDASSQSPLAALLLTEVSALRAIGTAHHARTTIGQVRVVEGELVACIGVPLIHSLSVRSVVLRHAVHGSSPVAGILVVRAADGPSQCSSVG